MYSIRGDRRSHAPRAAHATGFTLLELAVSLAIMAVLAVGILVPFVAQVAQRKVADTERILEQAREALLGYATATGRLPCPATAASNGLESFAAGGTVANGNCTLTGTHFIGFFPAATLGFTPIDANGYAIDGWATGQNRIRYAVANQTVNGSANPFTRTDGMRDATPAQLATADLLFVCSSGTGAVATPPACGGGATTLTRNAPAVIWSSGANAGTGGTSVHEAQNPHSNGSASPAFGSADRIFVSRTMADTAGGEFDDVVTWLSVGNLVSRMVLGGQLP